MTYTYLLYNIGDPKLKNANLQRDRFAEREREKLATIIKYTSKYYNLQRASPPLKVA